MTDKLISKLGKNKGLERSRIWIEGARLIEHGFTRGATYVREFDEGDQALYLATVTPEDILTTKPYKVAGKGDKPIIDITGVSVADWFHGFTHVSVEYRHGAIKITGHAVGERD